jgi:hypothetical protein
MSGMDLSQYVEPEISEQMEIYQAYLQHQSLLVKTVNEFGTHSGVSQTRAYYNVTVLDRQLKTWYEALPSKLQWRPENIQKAHLGFFLLQ